MGNNKGLETLIRQVLVVLGRITADFERFESYHIVRDVHKRLVRKLRTAEQREVEQPTEFGQHLVKSLVVEGRFVYFEAG